MRAGEGGVGQKAKNALRIEMLKAEPRSPVAEVGRDYKQIGGVGEVRRQNLRKLLLLLGPDCGESPVAKNKD